MKHIMAINFKKPSPDFRQYRYIYTLISPLVGLLRNTKVMVTSMFGTLLMTCLLN